MQESNINFKLLSNYTSQFEKFTLLQLHYIITNIIKFNYISKNDILYYNTLLTSIHNNFNENINHKIITIKNSTIHKNYLKDNDFLSTNIENDIHNNLIIQHKIEIDNYKNLELYIYTYKDDDINNYKKKIINIINLFNKIFKCDFTNKTIIFYMSNITKNLGKNNILTPNEINTGATLRNKYIIIWRKEEYEKVFIHELFHLFNFDFDNNVLIDNIFNKKINIIDVSYDNIIKYNEAYTEIVALIFYISYITCKMSKLNDINLFHILFNLELMYSLTQGIKIFKFYKWDVFNCIYSDFNKITKLTQHTNVFSYYIIKLFVLLNMSKFTSFLKLNTTNYFYFNKNNKSLIEFGNLINDVLFNDLENIKLFNNYSNLSFNNTSMRMICIILK
jgi:hypothetical protein